MLKDITLGQFFPGNTLIHRLDPRGKLIILFAFITLLLFANHAIMYGLLLFYFLMAMILSKVAPRALFRGMKPMVIIILFTVTLNLLYGSGENILWSWWIFDISSESIEHAVFMALRLLMLVSLSFLLTYTTSPLALSDGLGRLLSPLVLFRIPVHEFAMMMTIALRFIPTIIEETDKIMSAQKARGADFETGHIFRRAKAMIPVLVPLFISAFRRADDLANAMECRCYNGSKGRTRMKQMRFSRRDMLAVPLSLLFFGGMFAARQLGWFL